MKNAIVLQIIIWAVVGLLIAALFFGGLFFRTRSGTKVQVETAENQSTDVTYLAEKDQDVYVDLSFALDSVEELDLDLQSETMIILPAENDRLRVIHRGKNLEPDDYYSAILQYTTLVVERTAPTWGGVLRQLKQHQESVVEIYVPQDYQGGLTVHVASGSLQIFTDLAPANAEFQLASGKINGAYDLETNNLIVEAASGRATFTALKANIFDLNLASGALSVSSLSGSGNISLKSGRVLVSALNLADHLDVDVTSGSADIGLLGDPGIDFESRVASGAVHTYFSESIDDGNGRLSDSFGSEPRKSITAGVMSGKVNFYDANSLFNE